MIILEKLLDLIFQKSEQSYDSSKNFKCTYKIKFLISNISDKQLGLVNFRLYGQARDDFYHPQFTAVKYSAPKRLMENAADEVWLIANDDSFPRFKKHKKLYLIVRIADTTGHGLQKSVFEFQSDDWLDGPWKVVNQFEYSYHKESEVILKDITLNFLKNEPPKEAVHPQNERSDNIENDRESTTIKDMEENAEKEQILVEDLKPTEVANVKQVVEVTSVSVEKQKSESALLDSDSVKISIIDATLKRAANNKEYFMIWIELENNSTDMQLFSFQNFHLIDCDGVNLKYSGFINGNEPSSDSILPKTKDRFHIAFSTGKTRNKASQLTLSFDVNIAGYDDILHVAFLAKNIDEKWTLQQYQFEPQRLPPDEKKINDKLAQMESGVLESIHQFEKDYGVEFKNIGLSKNDDKLVFRGLVRSVTPRKSFLKVTAVALDVQERAIDSRLFLITNSEWMSFENDFYKVGFNKIHSLIIVSG